MTLMISQQLLHNAVNFVEGRIANGIIYYAATEQSSDSDADRQEASSQTIHDMMLARQVFHQKIYNRFGNNRETPALDIAKASIDLIKKSDCNGYGKIITNEFINCLAQKLEGFGEVYHTCVLSDAVLDLLAISHPKIKAVPHYGVAVC